MALPDINCDQCGRTFTPKRRDAKTCTTKCSWKRKSRKATEASRKRRLAPRGPGEGHPLTIPWLPDYEDIPASAMRYGR